MIGDQLELGLVIPVREATSLAGIVDPARRQRCPAKETHATRVLAACARPLSRESPNNCPPAQSCKIHSSTLLAEIILDNLFVLD